MISFYGSQIVAYQSSAEFYCVNCWRTPGDTDKDEKLEHEAAVIRYDAEEYAAGDGLWCYDCGAEIVAPDEHEEFYKEPSEEVFEDRPGAFEAESDQEYLNYPKQEGFVEINAESTYMEGERDGELPNSSS